MKSFVAATLVLLTSPALAEDRALILGNERYHNAANITAAAEALQSRPALEAAGFRVISGLDLTTDALRAQLDLLLVDREAAERLVILLAGHFVRSERGTWFLGVDADAPGLATVDGQGLPLATVLEIASGAPGGALVLLGSEERRIRLGAGLAPGIGPLDIPQGVSVIRGDAALITSFATLDLVQRGQSLSALVAARPDLIADGFLSDLVPFLPAEPGVVAGSGSTAVAAETAFWEATKGLATLEAYEAYLKRYPGGLFSTEALVKVTQARAEPSRDARLAEEALALTRDQQREVQRALSLLGFNTRGIDGIFGSGTRAAIIAWQQANAVVPDGYLTTALITRITAQADRRAAELEAEAAKRQAQLEALDRAYWAETGAKGDETGLRAYVKRYPDGLFSEVASDNLTLIEEARLREAETQDRFAWDLAEATNTEAGYRAYLHSRPTGAFAETARARIAALTQTDAEAAVLAAARAAEAALGLNNGTRNLVERRLNGLGLKPGLVDGQFDEDSRRAIRRYQAARDLPVTGYLSEPTLVRLLADKPQGN